MAKSIPFMYLSVLEYRLFNVVLGLCNYITACRGKFTRFISPVSLSELSARMSFVCCKHIMTHYDDITMTYTVKSKKLTDVSNVRYFKI